MAKCAHAEEVLTVNEAALAGALAQAETRCAEASERLTGPRRRVLELLLRTEGPAKAYDLIAGFGENGQAAKPPTVYRALDFLEKQGFVHRIESLNAYVACRRVGETHSAAFLICDCCGATREVAPFSSKNIGALFSGSGYEINSLTVEARGLCAACRKE
jgi:Fur family zinc uptake transcriptional regulator